MKKYSIVIPTYNHCDDFLKPCVESILKLSKHDEIEICISANGCKDNTKEYLIAIQEQYPDIIKWTYDPAPLGYSRSTNRGIQIATGEYVVLLNNDTVVLDHEINGWLERLQAPFNEDPDVGITGIASLHSPVLGREFLIFFLVMMRNNLFKEIGYLDEDFPIGGSEDMEFCYRTELAGYKLKNIVSYTVKAEHGDFMVCDYPLWHVGEGTTHDKTLVDIDLNEDNENNTRILYSKTRTPIPEPTGRPKAILKHTWAGLGDNLCHSTLPEIFHNKGYDVYISLDQEYRNEGIKQLIDLNPYIKGYTARPGNVNVDALSKGQYPGNLPNKSYQARLEYMVFGESYNNHPKIYYTPKYLPEWSDKTFVDFASVTEAHPVELYWEYAQKHHDNCVRAQLDYKTKDIFEYIDIIYSCKKFLCTYSGGNALASAINKKNTDCYITDFWLQHVIIKGGYCYHYTNVNYIAIDNDKNSIINVGKSEKLVHIITATHKRLEPLKRAIKSIQNQKHQNFIHHIIADGHDKDVAEYIESLEDDRFKYSCTEHEGSLGGLLKMSMINSLKSSDQEYLCFLDDDNEMYPEYISKLLKNIEGQEDRYGVSCCQIYMDKFDYDRFPEYPDIGEDFVKFECIDTLNYMVRLDLAKPFSHLWLHEYGSRITHDFDFINAIVQTTKLKFLEEVLGTHGHKIMKTDLSWMKSNCTTRFELDTYTGIIENNNYLIDETMKDKTVIDIGANIGAFSILCASKGAKEVFAVEPTSRSYSLLEKNVNQSGYSNIRLFKNAVLDKADVDIVINTDDDCSVCNNIYSDLTGNCEVVKSITLQDILNQTTDNDIYLKIDCEGSEYEILLNASYQDMSRITDIGIEIHTEINPNYKGYDIIANKLREFGFELVSSQRPGMWWTNPDGTSYFEASPQYEERWERRREPRVMVQAVCFNEIELIPHFINHYQDIVDKIYIVDGGSNDGSLSLVKYHPKVEIVSIPRKELDDIELNDIRNNVWKQFRNDYDWIICVDMDEFIEKTNFKNNLIRYEKEGVSVVRCYGYDMISEFFPHDYSRPIGEQVIKRLDNPEFNSKYLLFNANMVEGIDYEIGCHRANPKGNVKLSSDLMIYNHYKYVGYDYFTQKSNRNASRLSQSDKDLGLAWHYAGSPMLDREVFFDHLTNKSF